MGDENLYLEATKEVESEKRDPALWAKVQALTEGAQDKAKYAYIKLRVEQLAQEKPTEKPTSAKKIVDEFNLKYMPIGEFSRIKGISENKIIEMIRNGFYVGHIKNNLWFVSRDEVGKEEQAADTKPKPSRISKRPEKAYIPIDEFAEYKGLEPEKVIEMIREGSFQGQRVNGQWWVYYTQVESKGGKMQSLYEAILGEKNCIHYLTKFEQFDQQGPGLKASWNWAAFLVGGVWGLYRKMYGWFFAFWGIATISGIFEAAGSPGWSALVFFAPWIAFTIFSNSLYHESIKKKIAVAQLMVEDESKLIEYLRYKGGVHTWVIWVSVSLPVIGILMGILIPMFASH